VLVLLLEQTTEAEPVRRPGRPKGSANKATSFNPEEFAPKKRAMSAEGKARIAAAQKKRWAAQNAVSTKRPNKTVSPKLAGKVAPKTAKKSAGAGKRTGPTQGKTQTVPAKRSTAVAKKGAARKAIAKKMTRPASKRPAKQVAAPTPEPQTTE
jgi:hypothetical protein